MLESLGNFFTKIQDKLGNMDPFVFGILFFGGLFALLLLHAQYKRKLDWLSLITCTSTNKVSLTKLLQMVGGVTATWVVIYQTYRGQLGGELFLTYLCYVGAIEGWAKFVAARYSGFNPPAAPQQPASRPPESVQPTDAPVDPRYPPKINGM